MTARVSETTRTGKYAKQASIYVIMNYAKKASINVRVMSGRYHANNVTYSLPYVIDMSYKDNFVFNQLHKMIVPMESVSLRSYSDAYPWPLELIR